MTPEQFDSVHAAFLTLRALPTTKAMQRLSETCGGDIVIEHAVRRMLEHDSPDDRAHDETLPPLVLGTNLSVQSFLSVAEPGQRIGPYRIIRLIGCGGQAEVYEPEQTGPSRRVAVKIIKLGMDSRDVIARFEGERQALAMMDHPNIAKVFDSGVTPQGRPFFVMEYVPGVAVTEHCDRHRLTVRQRLDLFSLLCNAVSHAHTKGVIHRDLKPSNILVTMRDTDEAVPVIIDFGVAKATQARLTEHTMFTEQGVMIGTPEYMSPEQADMTQNDIDTRSDVYSLGVVLYELLSGAVPFESKTLRERGLDEIRRIIREETPQRPSTKLTAAGKQSTAAAEARRTHPRELARQLSHELEWIPLKALRKNRDERYRSAQELGDDLRNYLEGRPLIAGPETAGYRARKFVRRNRIAILTSGTILAVVIAGTVSSYVFYKNAYTQHQRGLYVGAKTVSLLSEIALKMVASDDVKTKRMAADVYGGAYAFIKDVEDTNTPTMRSALHHQGIVLQMVNDHAAAAPVLEQVWKDYRQYDGEQNGHTRTALFQLCKSLYALERWEEADAKYTELIRLLRETPTEISVMKELWTNLAAIKRIRGDETTARMLEAEVSTLGSAK